MIDPRNITRFNRTYEELQEFLIFCRVVAGKNSTFAAVKTADLIERTLIEASDGLHDHPFEYIQYLSDDSLMEALVNAGVGNYKVTFDFLRAVQDYTYAQLQTIHREELIDLPGVGPKTASFFIVHSRKNAKYAVLDRHIMKWLHEEHGYYDARSHATPQSMFKYRELELGFLRIAAQMEMTPAELDLHVWKMYADKDYREYERLITVEARG